MFFKDPSRTHFFYTKTTKIPKNGICSIFFFFLLCKSKLFNSLSKSGHVENGPTSGLNLYFSPTCCLVKVNHDRNNKINHFKIVCGPHYHQEVIRFGCGFETTNEWATPTPPLTGQFFRYEYILVERDSKWYINGSSLRLPNDLRTHH